MSQPNIIIRGLTALQDTLVRIQVGVGPVGRESMEQAVLYVHSQTPSYPAPPPASTYRRTGTLGRTVTSMRGDYPEALSRVDVGLGARTVGYVGTSLEYAPWVIGEDTQARVHRNRWWTLEQVVRNSWTGIRRIFEQNYSRLVRG